MIGREREYDRLFAPAQRVHRSSDDRRRGIAAMRLEQDIGLDANLGELLGNQKPVLVIGDDNGPTKYRRLIDPTDGFLKRRVRTKQS